MKALRVLSILVGIGLLGMAGICLLFAVAHWPVVLDGPPSAGPLMHDWYRYRARAWTFSFLTLLFGITAVLAFWKGGRGRRSG
jgi:hypothetical protein